MKKSLWVLLVGLVAAAVAADREETLLSDRFESGGFGGPLVQFTNVNGVSAVMAGGRGGWIINHHFILGGAGYGLVSNVKAGWKSEDRDVYLQMGYCGIWLEYISRPQKLLHLSCHTLVGGGDVMTTWKKKGDHDADSMHDEKLEGDSFFVLEPGCTLTLNVARFFRIGAGISYRRTFGASLPSLQNSDFSGLGMNLFFNFGKF